ncbi:MAG: PLP-dependent transferase, partial [Myxococcales bacterium]|nr:PLP-dependent transferase [Myxococcales bacterium]
MKFDTACVRAGISPDPTTGAIIPPIYQTATYVLDEVGVTKGFDYTRASNPTRQTLENALAGVEGAKHGATFASGMAAVDAVLRTFDAGTHVICSDDVYGGVSRLFNTILARHGFEFTYVDTSYPERVAAAVKPNTRLIWMETPTNPLLKVSDVEAIAAIGKKHDLVVAVDSTFCTPAILRPLELGATLAMHSTTKYLSGHNQIIGGVVLTNDDAWYEKLRYQQKAIGGIPSPFDCWLVMMGLKTLHLRMQRHSENGMIVAEFLAAHPKVSKVNYPGLATHPFHEVAKRTMKGYSGMISFELTGGIEAGRTLMNSVEMCSLAESLGAVETMVTHPA